jgi:hypothetical protein
MLVAEHDAGYYDDVIGMLLRLHSGGLEHMSTLLDWGDGDGMLQWDADGDPRKSGLQGVLPQSLP